MAGFTNPSILFLSTWDTPERALMAGVLRSLRNRGYTRYVEPCAGAFAMPLVAQNVGWSGPEMEASDTSLFSSIVGTMLSGGDFAKLQVQLDGEDIELPDADQAGIAARLLWIQLLTRTQQRPDAEYWRRLVEDLIGRQAQHEAAIRDKLQGHLDRIGGLQYYGLSVWDHLDLVADDPTAVISMNPPTYKGAYEKFFDTAGRLTWDQPSYQVWDPETDNDLVMERMHGKAALIISQQQQQPGRSAHPNPVFARHLSLGQYVYLNSNRPEEVFEITGGPRVAPRRLTDITPLDLPLLDPDHEITEKSVLQLVAVKGNVADYYRALWMHRLKAHPGGLNVLAIVDGMAAGIIGYSFDSISMPYSLKSQSAKMVMLRFAFGAQHHTLRMTRLATMLALRQATIQPLTTQNSVLALAASDGVVTIEYTKHPEAKGLRGLMKQVSKEKHPNAGFKLVYQAPWDLSTGPLSEVLAKFLRKEAQWQRTRQQNG